VFRVVRQGRELDAEFVFFMVLGVFGPFVVGGFPQPYLVPWQFHAILYDVRTVRIFGAGAFLYTTRETFETRIVREFVEQQDIARF
jgi:hypothetical protein